LPSEIIFSSLKTDRVHDAKHQTMEAAKNDVLDWITWYNTERSHSSLAFVALAIFEANLIKTNAAIAA
jgi:putative transposase